MSKREIYTFSTKYDPISVLMNSFKNSVKKSGRSALTKTTLAKLGTLLNGSGRFKSGDLINLIQESGFLQTN